MVLPQQEGEGEEKERDPGAAVALGAALLVRLLVPAWVVNATPLPISAIVLPRVKPPPKAPPPQVRLIGASGSWEASVCRFDVHAVSCRS